jgi:hypothetical protein
MRRRLLLFALALCVSVAGLEAQRGAGRWTLLGTRTVTDRLDHDTIMVTATRGTFDALRFEVRGRSVDFHRVVIHFANGRDQDVQMRDTVRAGGASRVIDIDGRDRTIRSIDFWYDANSIGRGGRATVRVQGRH